MRTHTQQNEDLLQRGKDSYSLWLLPVNPCPKNPTLFAAEGRHLVPEHLDILAVVVDYEHRQRRGGEGLCTDQYYR